MPTQPPELSDVLSRLQAPTGAILDLRQSVLACIESRDLREASDLAESALRDSLTQNDRHQQAFACALLAAVYACQEKFDEAARQAEDCHRLFNQMGDQIHNAMVARVLLAVIHQKHLGKISRALIDVLQEGQAHSRALSTKALGKGAVALAEEYEAQSDEFGDWMRQARWMQAFPHLLPLVWVPVINMPSDVEVQGAEVEAFMEPALFVLKTKNEVEDEEKSRRTSVRIQDALYTARPLPLPDGLDSGASPPRLKPNAVYAAIKIDPESARLPGFEPDDYLLVRRLSSVERMELLKQANANISGLYFEVNASGQVEFVHAIPPKFVGEEHVRMFVAQVDAILRRVP